MKTVYLHRQNNRFLSVNVQAAYQGFAKRGHPTKGFTSEQLPLITAQSKGEFIVAGGINSLRNIIKMAGVKAPEIHNPHDHLPQYCNRNIYESTLGEVRQIVDGKDHFQPFFIKPLVDDKTFTGFVLKNQMDLFSLRNLPGNMKLMVSEVVNFVSEYRCFVMHHHLIGSKNYTGSFKVLPDFDIVENAIKDYKDQKAAYSIDFGTTDKGETLLIEINDAFGLSAYGLDPVPYSQMLEVRWEEIMRGE